MNTANNKFSLFSVIGIEIEYMVVNKTTLEINPIVDKVFQHLANEITDEIDCGPISLNNELALHVVELKTNGPTADIVQAEKDFYEQISALNQTIGTFDSCLMPTGMHPLLDPHQGVELWPHGQKDIYEAYNRIFDCRGHGWSNLQSVHINLPFGDEHEFIKLHNAIRIILPLIPAYASSTPICEGKASGLNCTRMSHYINNQKIIPEITGHLIPEPIHSIEEYHQVILAPMYSAISSHDPNKILQEEWLNSRGAITRFDRNAIEIRVVDSQECLRADFAVIALTVALIKYIIKNTEQYLHAPMPTETLKALFMDSAKNGLSCDTIPTEWLDTLGLKNTAYKNLSHVLAELIERCIDDIPSGYHPALSLILERGNLSTRILANFSKAPTKDNIENIYRQLCSCLNKNEQFV